MRIELDSADLNGQPPELEGEVCQALVCQQHWYKGELNDPCNGVYIKTADRWDRVYFDHGIVFWRKAENRPQPFDAPEIDASYRMVDMGDELGVIGTRIDSVSIVRENRGSAVKLCFDGGKSVRFFCSDKDETSVSAGSD